ncbi:cleavage and polyadenylation specificity factor subunit 1-like [Diadema antillarum]|uniref:cleavage and polyadenylation specificity factor subunit 1-like n=1 Tax=Diadema antillarum TaxID=105358 RepID=UPI003A8444FA
MYAFHREVHPPTGVEHCVYCHFFTQDQQNLVVAKGSELTVYSMITVDSNKPADKDSKPKQKLEQAASFRLYGQVMSMKTAQVTGSGRDALLLSFMNAKLSIVEYDPSMHDLKTVSMHYFEDDESKEGSFRNIHHPHVRVDPDQRCAIMLTYGYKLVVLPFRRDGLIEDLDKSLGSSRRGALMPSYTIKLNEMDEPINNILDIQFLHGYYEPTLLILYEPLRTWAGRVAVRQDTCAIVALSLNMAQKVHPIIWSQSSLPYDCQQVYPVPKPIGGVLIMAVNSLLYLNQSIPPYGVALNSLTDWSSAFPLKTQEGVKLSLDCTQATFISYDRLALSLKDGEIYVLTLLVDGMRSVRGFHLDKAAASVLTTCICPMGDGYLFLGSRLGNSLLLRYTEKVSDTSSSDAVKSGDKKADEPPSKKIRSDDASDWMASDTAFLDDADELEVYGKEIQKTGTHLASYSFEICDSLLNIGPCGNMIMGEPAFLSEEFHTEIDPDLELVTTSGYGKNGALSVLQRTVRPQVVTTFQLPGCLDVWTVKSNKQQQPEEDTEEKEAAQDAKEKHAFLILSKQESSMVLQTGQEITEVAAGGFSTQGPTIFAGNMGEDRYIVQVMSGSVSLMEGVEQVQHIILDVGSPVVHCSLADPYLLMLTEMGALVLLTLKPDQQGTGHRLQTTKPQLPQKSKILTLATFKDKSGVFTTASQTAAGGESGVAEKATKIEPSIQDTSTIDDEDELLYGSSEPVNFSPAVKVEEKPSLSSEETEKSMMEPSYWCVCCRESGQLEIYSLPDMAVVFLVKNFPMATKVLVDSGSTFTSGDQTQQHEMLQQVQEVMLVGLGHNSRKIYMLALVEDDLLIYEAFPYHSVVQENKLRVRFRKVPHNILMKVKKTKGAKKTTDGAGKPEPDSEVEGSEQTKPTRRINRFREFHNVSTYSGVFISGSHPYWLFVTTRGALRMHPMPIDGAISCFASFHNVNCPHGFLYFNRKGELRICVLPSHLSYDAPWPVRKVPLRCTPHFVAYHVETKTYSVVTSVQETKTTVWRVVGEDFSEEPIERDDRFVHTVKDFFSIQLFSPLSWDAIPNTRIEYEPAEQVTCLKVVNLNSEGSITGRKGFMAVATTHVYTEDLQSRGSIYIYDVIEVVPEPGQPLTKNKLKPLYSKRQKGPVSTLCDVLGYLLSSVGQKVYMWQFKDNDLVGLAFIDTQIYIHNAVSIKQFVLVTDVMKSVYLLQYQERDRTLSLVSRDSKPLEVYACEFMVDDSQIAFLASDVDKNLILFHYQPEARESSGGMYLLRRADINAGAHINTFARVRCRLTDPSSERPLTGPVERRHVAFYATLDGSIGLLLPMIEKTYRRLLMLQNALTNGIPHTGGLNPKSYRHVKSHVRYLSNPHRNVIDGDLLMKYCHLSVVEKNEFAKKIGTSVDQIMSDLMLVETLTMHF